MPSTINRQLNIKIIYASTRARQALKKLIARVILTVTIVFALLLGTYSVMDWFTNAQSNTAGGAGNRLQETPIDRSRSLLPSVLSSAESNDNSAVQAQPTEISAQVTNFWIVFGTGLVRSILENLFALGLAVVVTVGAINLWRSKQAQGGKAWQVEDLHSNAFVVIGLIFVALAIPVFFALLNGRAIVARDWLILGRELFVALISGLGIWIALTLALRERKTQEVSKAVNSLEASSFAKQAAAAAAQTHVLQEQAPLPAIYNVELELNDDKSLSKVYSVTVNDENGKPGVVEVKEVETKQDTTSSSVLSEHEQIGQFRVDVKSTAETGRLLATQTVQLEFEGTVEAINAHERFVSTEDIEIRLIVSKHFKATSSAGTHNGSSLYELPQRHITEVSLKVKAKIALVRREEPEALAA